MQKFIPNDHSESIISSQKLLSETPTPYTLTSRPSDAILSNSLPPQIHLFKSQIILNPTISRINFAAYLIYSFFITLINVPIGLLQMPLLGIVYGLPNEEQINVVTVVQIIQISLKILYLPFLGLLCDRYGRKPFVIVGVISLSIGIVLAPNLPNVFPYYYLICELQDFGLSCMMTPPLLADYIDYETKGRVAGLGAVIAAFASFLASTFIEKMNLQNDIPAKYHEVAIAALVLGILLIMGLKGGPYHKALYVDKKAEEAKLKAAQVIEQEKLKEAKRRNTGDFIDPDHVKNVFATNPENKNQALDLIKADQNSVHRKPNLMTGFREARRNPWILAGYIVGFLFYSTVTIVNGVLVNYVIHVTGNEDEATQAYVLTNKQILAAIFFAILFGFISDKYNKFKIIIFIILCSLASILLLVFAPTPYNFMAYISMIFFGVSMAGFDTFNNQIISKYPNPRYRASVSAVSSMCSTIGGSMNGILGIYLTKYNIFIPFYFQIGAIVIALLILTWTYITKKDILNKL